jgi:hypothetical protein
MEPPTFPRNLIKALMLEQINAQRAVQRIEKLLGLSAVPELEFHYAK